MRRSITSVLSFSLLLCCSYLPAFAPYGHAQAASLPGWTRTCRAANRITGAIEPVPDANVTDPNSPLWGVTQPVAGGGWRILFNTARIFGPASTPAVLKFLFYHECAHAQTGNADEAVADCEALRMMDDDIGVSDSDYAEIEAAYASVGRPFPSGNC